MGEKMYTPPKRFRPFQAEKGPWLIWSYHWNCWHMRSSTGSAAGYTSDMAQAGVFDETTARGYHDTGPRRHRRDVSIPAARVKAAMVHRLTQMTAERDALVDKIASFSQRSDHPLPPSETNPHG